MAHIHGVSDSDTHFIIDPITRVMKNETSKKTTLILGDHNSERFTFELPRHIEGHDMSTCNKVEVHFMNVDAETRQTSKGIYIVDDFQIDPNDQLKVSCSWLISQTATKYKGVLNFVVRYTCGTDDNIDYVWSTAIYSSVTVADGICNTENVLAEYIDVLEAWKAELYSAETVGTTLLDIDDEPTDESPNLVTSGGVKKYYDKAVNTKYTLSKTEDGTQLHLTGTDGITSVATLSNDWAMAESSGLTLTEGAWELFYTTTQEGTTINANFGVVYFDGATVSTAHTLSIQGVGASAIYYYLAIGKDGAVSVFSDTETLDISNLHYRRIA